MTPMDALINPSLRLPGSWEIRWSSWKIDSTKGCNWMTVDELICSYIGVVGKDMTYFEACPCRTEEYHPRHP